MSASRIHCSITNYFLMIPERTLHLTTTQHLERNPDLDQAKRGSTLAHSVVIKLKEMGLPDKMDEHLSKLCTDLADLCSAQRLLASQVDAFLKSEDDWDTVGDNLVDIRATIDHMGWHMKGVRRPMTQITSWAYRQNESDETT